MAEDSETLAERLRDLRKQAWPGVTLTQTHLARAFGVSTGLLSSWENSVVPPQVRLEAYATFFATKRSIERKPYRVLPVGDLVPEERDRRNVLLKELQQLRDGTEAAAGPSASARGGRNLWQFPPGQDIVIVCARLPETLRQKPFADPESPDYVELYTYADLDSLVELVGHIRMCNPDSEVTFRTTDERTPLKRDDNTAHLIVLGGVDWNTQTRALLNLMDLPVRQVRRDGPDGPLGGFEVSRADGDTDFFSAELDRSGHLVADVAHLYHGRNPFNPKRTVTLCNGTFGRGTYGVVRALTDKRFRVRNQEWLDERFGDAESFSIISRVTVFRGAAITPDWALTDACLHTWPQKGTEQ
ncbi:helix-turn-helix domain-containing protein [Amycolatopsis saalfeldensis]|uniref:Transcriptional regulator, contains XRE-family HTH domain n=1 Tax=Amycolatopsis saalfeldensis TaxID=394193 RepID=A0A1H8XVF0_9PSEU|nr:helix-turn-helix transcriptional regulator [Amycolatopsis saalfeldensis]SEP43787.1 Transcriptional regulator, contains XRE-family HTH domain [Amycolatopsis saalfeldensis]